MLLYDHIFCALKLQCDSPYIITFFSAFFVENRISICTEFMDGEFLCDLSKQLLCFFLCQLQLSKRDFGEKSSFSLPCTHLHFCRSRECLIAVSCLACLCAKSYKGVINLDLSAVVGVFVCAFTGVRWRTVGFFCFLGGGGGKLYMFVKVCVNAVISLDSHIFQLVSSLYNF